MRSSFYTDNPFRRAGVVPRERRPNWCRSARPTHGFSDAELLELDNSVRRSHRRALRHGHAVRTQVWSSILPSNTMQPSEPPRLWRRHALTTVLSHRQEQPASTRNPRNPRAPSLDPI